MCLSRPVIRSLGEDLTRGTASQPSAIMSAIGLYRRFSMLVTGALALVAALVCGPSSARAACGDYVTVVGAASTHRPVADLPVPGPVPYTHLRAHETTGNLVCCLLLE